MKAVRIHEDGGPEVLRYEEAPDPVPGGGEVLVELRAASLNHLDLWLRQGLPSVPKPRILGADGAGVIAGTGERVVINPGLAHEGGVHVLGEHRDGTHAELVAVPRSAVHPIPAGLSFEEAAAFPLVFETAYRMLVTKAALQPGEWVLIWGIGSGLATAVLAIAKGLGAHTVVTSRSPAKLKQALALGADAALEFNDEIVTKIRDLTGGGAAVVVEHVGETTWASTLEAARFGGRVVLFGVSSGDSPPARLQRVLQRELSVYGSAMGTEAEFQGAYELVSLGRAKPVVDSVFPLAEAAAAHARLERSEQLGKIVLAISS
jgi:NADPH:quinone reductase-like Zn-dependent oxidoreductase